MDKCSLSQTPNESDSWYVKWCEVAKGTHVVQKFGPGVSFNIVRVKITPSELHVYPELVAGCTVQNVLILKGNFRKTEFTVKQNSRR